MNCERKSDITIHLIFYDHNRSCVLARAFFGATRIGKEYAPREDDENKSDDGETKSTQDSGAQSIHAARLKNVAASNSIGERGTVQRGQHREQEV